MFGGLDRVSVLAGGCDNLDQPSMSTTELHRGSCACGAVKFVVSGALLPAEACHCTRCRKLSGHYWVSTDVLRTDLEVDGADRLQWFSTSNRVRRAFCSSCGATLFWDSLPKDVIAVAMGAFDTPTQARIAKHIHVASKGDYYGIEDGMPQHQG